MATVRQPCLDVHYLDSAYHQTQWALAFVCLLF